MRTAKTRSLSDALIVLMHPVVMPEERLKWENYSMDMQGWVEESMIVQASDPNYFGPIVIENISEYQYGVIHGDYEDIPYNVTRPMLPQWQNGPCVTGEDYPAFNWDLMSQTSTESLDIVISTGQAVLSEAYMLPDEDNPEEIAEFQDWYEWFLPYMRANETPDEPANDLFYPFVVDSMTENVEANLTTGKVVAMLDVIFYWRDLMRDILPPDTTGIVVVFVNPCNPDFTYRIDGPTPVYLGRGDLHETKFDGLMLESSIHDLDSFSLRGG